jgi:integration host factor subunit alpha
MSLGKKDISKNISIKARISAQTSYDILNSFLFLVKNNSLNKTVKISQFGSFSMKSTPSRVGRNPKTKESYVINARTKLTLKIANKVKNTLN